MQGRFFYEGKLLLILGLLGLGGGLLGGSLHGSLDRLLGLGALLGLAAAPLRGGGLLIQGTHGADGGSFSVF